jgi:hypothetical protein
VLGIPTHRSEDKGGMCLKRNGLSLEDMEQINLVQDKDQ